LRFDEEGLLAKMLVTHWGLGLNSGVLIANPIPAEDEFAGRSVGKAIETALAEADAAGVKGAAVTPFLLDRVYKATHGKSLEANIALVKNNARLAARIAGEFCRREGSGGSIGFSMKSQKSSSE